jgi:hypothetical protein
VGFDGADGGREHRSELIVVWVERSTSTFVLQGDFHEPARRAVTRAAAAYENPCFRSSEYATTSDVPLWTCVCVNYFEFIGANYLSKGVLQTRMDVCNFCVVLRWI